MSVNESIKSPNAGQRNRGIKRVLWIILGLNILVAAAKLAWGLYSRSASMTADGFHSMFDGTSNVVGLVGMGFAARPADQDHPYGHTKYETYASVVIALMLLLAAFSIGREAIMRLMGSGTPPEVTVTSFAVMISTLIINIFVTTYERKEGKRLGSEILIADASHTKSDILVSLGVIVSLVLVKLGFGIADGIVSLGISVAIVWTAWGVFKQANVTLSDSARIPTSSLEACAMAIGGVISTHHVRTRGTDSEVYVDMHVVVNPSITVREGHAIAHGVEQCIEAEFPQVADVVIHVEPEGDEAE